VWEWVGYCGLFISAALAMALYVVMVNDRKD
jgi:hypothetical protein